MSAVFEVNVIYKGDIVFSELINDLRNIKTNYVIDSIEIMDDWEYNNHQILEIGQIKECETYVTQKKIFVLEGLINSRYRFGINFSKSEYEVFVINFWISTKNLEPLDSNLITSKNLDIYAYITQKLTTMLKKNSLISCCLGSEMLLLQDDNIGDIISMSKNVCQWIFSCEKNYESLKKFEKTILNGFVIYSLNETK